MVFGRTLEVYLIYSRTGHEEKNEKKNEILD
jgi:hypothetical protein